MTELDAPLKRTPSQNDSIAKTGTISVEGANTEEVLQSAESHSKDIADEALKKAAHDITQEIKQYASTDEQERPPITKTLTGWFSAQIHHISQTVVALLIATIVALVTPFLVKFELIDELQKLSNNLSNAVASNNTQGILESTTLISHTTETIEAQNKHIQSAFEDLENLIGNERNKIASIEKTISNYAAQQDKQYALLTQRMASFQQLHKPNAPFSSELTKKLSRYIYTGKTLLKAEEKNREEINNWIGEVYFFISLMPSQNIELNDVKDMLRQIHIAQKPFNDDPIRIQNTITVLKALQSWVTL